MVISLLHNTQVKCDLLRQKIIFPDARSEHSFFSSSVVFGRFYLFNESITCRTKRTDNCLHFYILASMINFYCSTI